MADSIKINLSDDYQTITEDDIKKAKQWTLLRNDNANKLSSLIEDILEETAKELTQIAYKYNCKPEDWQFSENKDLREDVAKLMDETEDRIFELVEDYSLNETDDEKRQSTLLPWLMALKSKGAKDLSSTLHLRLRQFLYDTEAQIAAMKLANYKLTKAINRVLSTLHSVYTSPEVQSAFNKKSAAMYIKSHGVHYGNVGLSSSGATNVENFGSQTATMAWMKSQLLEFIEEGAVGYYQLRGSTYPCSICDDETGLHIGDIENDTYPHYHCMCYRVPVKPEDEDGITTKKVYPNGAKVSVMDGVDTKKSDYKDLLTIARDFAQDGKDVTLMERIHKKDERYKQVYRALLGTKYENKCPDLLIDGKFYEYESFKRPWNKRKISNMLSHGLEQSDRIIIDNNGGANDRFIQRSIELRRKLPKSQIKEVWLYEKGKVRLFFKDGKFYRK